MFTRKNKYETKQRFTIKKFKIGVASVLIGTLFAGFVTQVSADQLTDETSPVATSEVSTVIDESVPSEDETTVPEANPTSVDNQKAIVDESTVVADELIPSEDETTIPEANPTSVDSPKATVDESTVVADESIASEDGMTIPEEKPTSVDSSMAIVDESTVATDESTPSEDGTTTLEVESTIAETNKTEKYKVTNTIPTDKENNAIPRPQNEGQAIPERTGFRIDSVTNNIRITENTNVPNSVASAFINGSNNANNTPTGWGINISFDLSQTKPGQTTKIAFNNLGEIREMTRNKKDILASDGKTVLGTITKLDRIFEDGGNRQPFWAQRIADGKTIDQRLLADPPIVAEAGKFVYTITWSEAVSQYQVAQYSVSNDSAEGFLVPSVSKNKTIEANIAVDGNVITSSTYILPRQNMTAINSPTRVSLETVNGITYNNNVMTSKNDSVVIDTDSDITYGVGTTFNVKLADSDFITFKNIGLKSIASDGGYVTYRPYSRGAGAKPNSNDVWILNDGRILPDGTPSRFVLTPRLISPTEVEFKITQGTIMGGSVVSIPLDRMGIEKAMTMNTFDYAHITYNDRGQIIGGKIGDDRTNATLIVKGVDPNGRPVGEGENVLTTVSNKWAVNAYTTQTRTVLTGEVIVELVDVATREVLKTEDTRYNGLVTLADDGSFESNSILGSRYDLTNYVPPLTLNGPKGEEYVRVDFTPNNQRGTINNTNMDIDKDGIPDTIVQYRYVRKFANKEVSRNIAYKYSDSQETPTNLRGTKAFNPVKQSVNFTGTIKVNAKQEAVLDENNNPTYINWTPSSQTLPEKSSPLLDNYTYDIAIVDEKSVSGDIEAERQTKNNVLIYDKYEASLPEVVVTYSPIVKTVTPIPPANPGDPLIPGDPSGTPIKPGDPIDPNNPDGPTWTKEQLDNLSKQFNRTIKYIDNNGKPISSIEVDKPGSVPDGSKDIIKDAVRYYRSVTINFATGEKTFGQWQPVKGEGTFETKASPVIKGYIANKKVVEGPEVTINNQTDSSTVELPEITVVYRPLGSYVPHVPAGFEPDPENPIPSIPYPNDPADPTKPGKP
ncbi:mucin-binding protein, partial [Streptococcus pacificus]